MRRLVIGCGYLGARIAELWRRQGDCVHALTRSARRAVEMQEAGLFPIIGDVMAPATLEDLPVVDTILYAVGFDHSASYSRRELVLVGLRNVISSLPDEPLDFLYVSSTSVYGQSQGEWVNESSCCHPLSKAGQDCLEAEELLERICAPTGRRPDLNLQIFRSSGLYGPQRLIGRIAELRQARPLTVNPDGWLNLIHVDDCAGAIVAGAERRLRGRRWLLSDSRPIRRRTFYAGLAERVGAPAPHYAPTPDQLSMIGKRCRSSHSLTELGYTLNFPSIDTGLRDAVERTFPTDATRSAAE